MEGRERVYTLLLDLHVMGVACLLRVACCVLRVTC